MTDTVITLNEEIALKLLKGERGKESASSQGNVNSVEGMIE